jgi:hypothetical protein
MSLFEKCITLGKEHGLSGKDLLEFAKERETKELEKEEREERMREREKVREHELQKQQYEERERERVAKEREMERVAKEREMERAAKERESIRDHELQLKRLENDQRTPPQTMTEEVKAPKLQSFVDGTDQLDSYLHRFERFAANVGWDKKGWAIKLSALLTGKALDVYSRLREDDANSYEKVKNALLKRYDYTEDGYRIRFREAKPEIDESPEQFVVRLQTYLDRWVELAKVAKSYEGVTQLFVREQFINAAPKDLAVHLRERATKTMQEMAEAAEHFLVAHDRKFGTKVKVPPSKDSNDDRSIQCYKCGEFGHVAVKCSTNNGKAQNDERKCFRCNKVGHIARDCGEQINVKKAGCAIQVQHTQGVDECIEDGQLVLANGTKVNLVGNACVYPAYRLGGRMPVMKGRVGEMEVDTLRDTGCSSVVVKESLVSEEQYTGKHSYMILVDNTVKKVPLVKISVDCPYLCGEVEALCLPNPMCDLIVGNVEGARGADDPDAKWQVSAAVTTRAQSKNEGKYTPLNVTNRGLPIDVSKDELSRSQKSDETLKKYRELVEKGTKQKGGQETSFEERDGILYRVFVHPHINRGKPLRQVLVPQTLRQSVMDVAHNTLMGGHMGARKTLDKILSNFFWPGINGDVTRFCRSCDICQKTAPKGRVKKVPLQRMPIIDQPFKRVAVDLVGPFHPPSEGGHRYILTLVDYATRYPEAIPLKMISTEVVAEALVDMYSRLGIPEEVLSDLGTQFVSECMQEVSKLLSVNRLTTTPYHPMCNGLVEKFNGTLKTMLRRLCSEQPKQWHRYINALLFAYREVPQESTGFSPFELLYGRTVRGPMHILKELWTNEGADPEVKSSYQYVFELRERMEETLKIAREELDKAQQRHKKYYDRNSKQRSFEVGSQVLVLLPSDNNKLLMQWRGPFEVEEVVRMNDYKVRIGRKSKIYHANLLKEYIKREDFESGAACVAVIEADEPDKEDHTEDDDLLDLDPYHPCETHEDVQFGENLLGDQKKQASDLIQQFQEIFTDKPGRTNLVEHRVCLTSEDPIRSKPYSVPYTVRESLKNEIREMMRLGVIRESSSPYASPVVIVRKKDGSNRVCIDYRKLNKITVVDPEPMTPAVDVFQRIGQDKYFSKIDLSKGYWQVPVVQEDIFKTAFVTPDGTYEFLKMPFGMMNSGATLVRGMRKLLEGMEDVESYIDDILVHSSTWEDHMTTLQELFRRMKHAKLTVRPSKCVFGAEEIEFLGHWVGQGILGLHEDNVDKIKKASRPTTKHELRSFMGLMGYYRDFIPNFAAVAVPLTDLTKKGKPKTLQWEEAQEKAYKTLKELLCKDPILHLPDPSKPYVLQTDASDYGIGAILMQDHNGTLFPVCYASKKLTDRERKYCTMERECLAVVWGTKKFINYLYGTQFTLQTDHQPLAYLNTAKFINGRIMRWAMYLQNFRIKVEAIRGVDNVGADYLSRVV